MFKSIIDWLNLKFDLAKESLSIKFTNYRGLWEQQNREIDSMRCSHNHETKRLESIIEQEDTEINNLKAKNQNLIDDVKNIKDKFHKYKTKSKEDYLDLMNKYQDSTLKVQDLINQKRILASSKGGLNSKIKYQDKKIKKLEKENGDIKILLQKLVKDKGRNISPPTRKELENYNLFGNRKGIRK